MSINGADGVVALFSDGPTRNPLQQVHEQSRSSLPADLIDCAV